jgi:putative tryptophan/tyrosine transport system substrate-binding protein
MRRRQFATLGVTGAAFIAFPQSSNAQQPRTLPRIGWLWPGHSAGNPQEVAGFRLGLKELGYVDQQNIIVDYRFGEGHYDHLAGLAAELIQLRPDVLVAVGPAATTAMKDTTSKLPIVSLSGDPVAAGFVASLARPGGNITGVSMIQGAEGLTGKRIELLKDALPTATRIGMMFNPDMPDAVASIGQAQQVASRRGLVLVQAPVKQVIEIDAALTTLARERVDAVHVEPGSPVTGYQREIAVFLLQHRIPAVSEFRLLIEAGGLFSYGPNIFETARRMAYFVDRILKGAKPADLPVEQATRLELVVNLKTAKLLDIELPPILLARADEVIE